MNAAVVNYLAAIGAGVCLAAGLMLVGVVFAHIGGRTWERILAARDLGRTWEAIAEWNKRHPDRRIGPREDDTETSKGPTS